MHIKAAAKSHPGKIRANNQDSGFTGSWLSMVADGVGGHAGGDIASAILVNAVSEVDNEFENVEEALSALRDSILEANTELIRVAEEHPEVAGLGTTTSAFIRVKDQLAICHIGDSRIYSFRGGNLTQETSDHTFVQRLVETGRITPEEAAVHPRRNVIMRVLGDVDQHPVVDTKIVDIKPDDRWLLCSDGLSSYVDEADIGAILDTYRTADQATEALLEASLAAGAPDNVTVIVVDVFAGQGPLVQPVVVGSASEPLDFDETGKSVVRLSGALLHPRKTQALEYEFFEPNTEQYLERILQEDSRRVNIRRIRWILTAVLVATLLVLGAVLGYRWTQTRYFIGVYENKVAIFQGVPTDLGPFPLYEVHSVTDIVASELPQIFQDNLAATIPADSLEEANRIVEERFP